MAVRLSFTPIRRPAWRHYARKDDSLIVYSQNSDGSDGVPNMVHSIYNTSVSTLNPHRLSYFLIILAIGVCVDQRRSHKMWTQDAERFHQLSRAALCETSVINEPSIDAINALVRTSSRVKPGGN